MRHSFVSLPLIRTALIAMAGVLVAAASAGPINYATHAVGIRAGVLLTDANAVGSGGTNYSVNPAPYVWYNLDRNTRVKPAGWYFYNPHAPGTVSAATLQRWNVLLGDITSSTPNGTLVQGSQINKATAPYWEVQLSQIGDSAINDYDVLILPISYAPGVAVSGLNPVLSLNPTERARLQRFVDHGGVLWIDLWNATVDPSNGPPLSFSLPNATNQVASVLNPASQVFSYPYTLTSLPEATYNSCLGPNNNLGALTAVWGSVPGEFSQYEYSATDVPGTDPTIVTARVGSGAIVVTSRGVAAFLNQATLPGVSTAPDPNIGFVADTTTPDANANQAARFAINAINLVNGSPQQSQSGRKGGASPIDIGSPLLKEWWDETKGTPEPGADPITYKGLVIVPIEVGNGQSQLFAYSAVPGSDLDSNGIPDDGFPDYALGKPRDLIWISAPINGPVSTPAAFEMPNAGGGVPSDMIAVVDQGGNLQTFNAFPLTANGTFNTSTAYTNPIVKSYSPPNGSTIGWGGLAPFGPTFHDGLIYITDNVDNGLNAPTGRIWVVDPRNSNYANSGSNGDWVLGGPLNGALGQITAGATIGYIPIADNSGGADRVLYVPTAPQNGLTGGQTCGITSIWAGTKGERHGITLNGGALDVQTRAQASSRPIFAAGAAGYPVGAPDPHGVHITLMTANGDALTSAQTAGILSGAYSVGNNFPSGGGADLVFQLTTTGAAQITNLGVSAVSIDYSLDWSTTAVSANPTALVRGSIQLPDDTNREKYIVGNLALSPAGTLYAVEALPSDGQADGMYYAIREQGQGSFTVVTRFDMYDAFTYSTPGVTAVSNQNVASTFQDADPTQDFSTYIGGSSFVGLEFESGPAVVDGRVFVKVRGYKRGAAGNGPRVPCMLLLCFAAEPALPYFSVPVLQSNFTIIQPDYNRSIDKTDVSTFTSVSASSVNYTQGSDHATISLNSLSTTTRSQLTNTLNESLPIIIQQPGSPNITIDPLTAGTWSPLQWYTVFYGLDPGTAAGSTNANWQTGAPVVTGNTVFLAANSVIPYIFQTGFNGTLGPPTGMLVGYNAGLTGSSDPFAVVPNPSRPYFTQISQISYNPVTTAFQANPDQEWPQNSTVTSFATYLQRMYQTVLDGPNLTNAPSVYGITAGQGGLFAYSNLGVYGYKRANFTVADEGRLASFDPAGNALWTTDSTQTYGVGVVTTAGQEFPAVTHPLIRPTRAYPISGSTDYLVVDPGANRLARINTAGQEVRSIDSFGIDPLFQPDGYISGEPLTFNQPQDVLTFSDFDQPTASGGDNSFSNAQALEYWRHYVIADTGNRRLVEIVDRYAVDPATRLATTPIALGVLFYHSPATVSGKKGYDYNSIARLLQPGTGVNNIAPAYVYATSLGTTQPSRTGLGLDTPTQDQIPTAGNYAFQARDARNGSGGIMLMAGGSTIVINKVVIPEIGANVLYYPSTGAFNPAPIPAQYKTLGGLSSVTMSYVDADTAGSTPVLTIMFTDSTGVYEISQAQNPITGGGLPTTEWVVDWMLPNQVYTVLRRNGTTILPGANPSELKATYARRTSAGTVLLVNSYFGVNQDQSAFSGEILELDGSQYNPNIGNGTANWGFSFNEPFLGFGPLSVVFQLPTVQGARGIVAPIFADRR